MEVFLLSSFLIMRCILPEAQPQMTQMGADGILIG